jgi:hypothetical protein
MDVVPRIRAFGLSARRPLAIGCTLAVMAAYYAVIMSQAVNIPHWDEYIITLDFLDRFDRSGSTWDVVQLLFSQANEHRIALYRIAILGERALFGDVDFTRMIALGNIGVLVFWAILWTSFPRTTDRVYYFLPVTLLLFAPVWERSQWAASSFFNTYANVFAFATLYCLSKEPRRYLVAAAICSVLAIFSFGNGIVVYPAGLGLLWVARADRTRLWTWAGVSLVVMVVYFWGYRFTRASIPTSSLFTNPVLFVAFVFSFFGAPLKYFSRYLAPFAGVSVLAWLLVLVLHGRRCRKPYALASSFVLFLLLSAGAVAVTRSGFGLAQALSPRYELIPAVFIAVLYLTSLQSWREPLKRQFGLIILCSIVLYAARMDANYTQIVAFRERLESGMRMYCANDPSALSVSPAMQEEVAGLFTCPDPTGNYRPPVESLLKTPDRLTVEEPAMDAEVRSQVRLEADSDEVYYAKGWAFIDGLDTQGLDVYLVLRSDRGQIFAFRCASHVMKDVTQDYGHGLYLDESGFSVALPKRRLEIPPGPYDTGIYLVRGEVRALQYLGRRIRIPE